MIKYNLSGTWRTIKNVYTNVNGSWKTAGQISVKVNGAWHNIWSYNWNIGGWGNCSVSCGGGTQTRTVNCRRNDGQTVADSLCTKYVGSKPATSQRCNTHACPDCRYRSREAPTYYVSQGNNMTSYIWDSNWILLNANGIINSYTSGGYLYTRGNFVEGVNMGYIGNNYYICRRPL